MPDVEHAQSFTLDALRTRVRSADGPVLVDFWEPRCTACRATLAAIDELACRVTGYGVVGTFNVRENPVAARSLGVESVPTLLVLRVARRGFRVVGFALYELLTTAPCANAPTSRRIDPSRKRVTLKR